MSREKSKPEQRPRTASPSVVVGPGATPQSAPVASVRKPPFFRRCDWIAFGLTTLLVFIGYLLTLAPDLTLEDSGELAVGSYYAGVPHPPGYPVWTLYTWFFTVFVPISNIAWRVALSSAVAAAFASGILALITSRGGSMILESIDELKNIDRVVENRICIVAGWVAGTLLGFNGFMWSQAVIVEVYTLSVLSLMLTFVFLMRWLYEPDRKRWLCWSFFMFGICFTNHQTLICAAMGLEVLIALRDPRLGRDLLLGNVLAYGGGLLLKAAGVIKLFEGNFMLSLIFHTVGILSLLGYGFLFVITRKKPIELGRDLAVYASVGGVLLLFLIAAGFVSVRYTLYTVMLVLLTLGLFYATWWLIRATRNGGREWVKVLLCGLCWLLGISFYLYMPLASMTNPPMNWGYPRTVDGFIHAFTRGQYEATQPTDNVWRFIEQCGMLFEGAQEEFSLVFLLVAIVPFVFFNRLKQRERAWLIGMVAIYCCLSFLLVILLNPSTDNQSRALTKVFFTSSHVIIAMFSGYGLVLGAALISQAYEKYRFALLVAASVFTAIALTGLFSAIGWFVGLPDSYYWLDWLAAIFALMLTVALVGLVWIGRHRLPLTAVLGLFAVAPAYSVMTHWADNEQRGHLFGFWFGHDMFIPPFVNPDGQLDYDREVRDELLNDPEAAKYVYPEMAENAILFGGTDPGRFCPTYMIFCESQIPPEKRRNPAFDRSDVYIITQNALADSTYLSYIRAHYNRSTQIDPPFFQELLRSQDERERAVLYPGEAKTNWLASTFMRPLDNLFGGIGERIEQRRREEGVYPEEEIYTPSVEDLQRVMSEYSRDAGRRKQLGQLKHGEIVNIVRGADGMDRVQVAGQVSVMAINAELCRIIFDQNPDHEFYIEESFPLDWMFPYLTPYGIIMKLNREVVPEFTEEMYERDYRFWRAYSKRLIGDWVDRDTPIAEICNFAIRMSLKDYSEYEGDMKFARDDQAQKSFSKLRGGIGGLYAWRAGNASPGGAAQQRALREAEFALKQSFAFRPDSPEAVVRLCNLLIGMPDRLEDALMVAQTAYSLDPNNEQFESLTGQLERYLAQDSGSQQMDQEIGRMLEEFRNNPADFTNGFRLASAYLQLGQTNMVAQVFRILLQQPDLTAEDILSVALGAQSIQNAEILELSLARLTQLRPQSPEAWYDLASLQAAIGKYDQAVTNLQQALRLSDARLEQSVTNRDLRSEMNREPRFNVLRTRPDFREQIAPQQ